jgi:hypothetical protein
MRTSVSVQLLAAVIRLVSGHGIIEDPAPRLAGLAMKAACGEQVYNNQKSDSGGNIQGILQVAQNQKDYDPTKCNIALCKGYQFADNTANVQTYSPGQVVPIKVAIKAPHTGVANVSIVNTKSNAVIGQPLISFSDYASNAHSIPANNTAFSITMPQDLSACGQAGNCVIQWFWDAPDIKQTYESCVDFQTGAGGAAPAASSVAPAASAAPKPKQKQAKANHCSEEGDIEERQAPRRELVKRQSASVSMVSMTNGPKTTLGMSAISMSVTPSVTGSAAASKATGSASGASGSAKESKSGDSSASKTKSGSTSGTSSKSFS